MISLFFKLHVQKVNDSAVNIFSFMVTASFDYFLWQHFPMEFTEIVILLRKKLFLIAKIDCARTDQKPVI